nr:hypothetical protein [Tanacetum cinerariifolium]
MYWESLPEDVLGVITQRRTGSHYPKMYWDSLPEDVLSLKLIEPEFELMVSKTGRNGGFKTRTPSNDSWLHFWSCGLSWPSLILPWLLRTPLMIAMKIEGEDLNEDPTPEEEDTKEEELYEGSDETEPFEEDKTAITPPPPIHRRERTSVRLQTPMAASTQALIDAFAAGSPLFPLPPTSPTYYQAPLAKSSAAARAPRGQYDFVDTVEARQGLIRSPGHDASNIARAADRVEDFGYVRALHASEHRMLTSIDERTAYKTELQEVCQAYLIFEAHNKALLARLETLETHISHMEWQRQSAEALAVTQMLRIYVLEARAQTDMVEDADSCQPEYHAPSDDDIQVEDQPHADDASLNAESPLYIADSNSIGEDDDEDPEEDPSEKHEPEDDD